MRNWSQLLPSLRGFIAHFLFVQLREPDHSVITTVSTQDIDFVKRLEPDEAIDYTALRFEKEVRDVNVVFDAVGGDTLDRSWGALKPGGRMITIAADSEGTVDQRVKDAFFIVDPKQEQPVEVTKQLDAEYLRAFVKTAVPLNEASVAYSGAVRDKRIREDRHLRSDQPTPFRGPLEH